MTTKMIQAYTIRTSKQGEIVTPDIILNGGSVMLGGDRFPITENLFGAISTQTRIRDDRQETILTGIPLLQLPAVYSSYANMDWTESLEDNDGYPSGEKDFHEPLCALVLLKARCRTNLRVPMGRFFWREWVYAGSLKSDETSKLKNQLRDEFPKDFDIRNSGALKIAPDGDQKNRSEYLVMLANNGSFEWVLGRSDGTPNTYRVEFKNGQLNLIDPRIEAKISGEGVNGHNYQPNKDY